MSMSVRDTLRSSVIDTLLATFPGAQKVTGGVAFMSDAIDEETGTPIPVEIKIVAKSTQDTARSKAYDLDAAVAKAATKAARKQADPEKAAQKAAEREAAKARKEANVAILRDWVIHNLPEEGLITSKIAEMVPGFENLTNANLQVGTYLTILVNEGVLERVLDEKRRKVYKLVK